jgi:dTDP-4-amino-4,6-dideoxygalactose transaminase
MSSPTVPFFRPDIGEQEIAEVVDTLRSGWLTTGPKVRAFEEAFRAAVGADHALGVNSCTAALHLALNALGVGPGQAVLVPTMTFAATAAVVLYQGAIPVLVDCDPATANMDLGDAALKIEQLTSSTPPGGLPPGLKAVGIVPVHVGGLMMDVKAVHDFAAQHGLWTVEDAAHAFPAGWRAASDGPWQRCGQGTASISCFSFYANKTITTGEGGMAVTNDRVLADRMRLMALHGLSRNAWDRYTAGGSWDYKIMAPGFKYNLTDVAAAIGIHQLHRAEAMRQHRERVAQQYMEQLRDVDEIELPTEVVNRIHAWHLFPIRLRTRRLNCDRAEFITALSHAGIGCSVHWRPLHLHPYYQRAFEWHPDDLPVASALWERSISLPIFAGMRQDEVERVTGTIKSLCGRHARPLRSPSDSELVRSAPR